MPTKYAYEIDMSLDTTATKIINLVGENKKVLEIGCSSGSQSKVLKHKFNCCITGVEIDEDAAREASDYCDRIIVGNIENLDFIEHFNNDKFDVIVLSDVLEHLLDPGSALFRLSDLLIDDGYIVISIPNIVHASIIHEMICGNFNYRSVGLLDNGHIRFFTLSSLVETLNNSGFVVDFVDRVKCEPSMTEFKTKPFGIIDKFVLKHVIKKNSESLTYQFVVKARKKII